LTSSKEKPRLLLLKQVVCDDTVTSFAKLVTVANAIRWDGEIQLAGDGGVVDCSH
jgi:hypothetical protein